MFVMWCKEFLAKNDASKNTLELLIMNQCASKVYKWVRQSGVQCVGLKASMEELKKKLLVILHFHAMHLQCNSNIKRLSYGLDFA